MEHVEWGHPIEGSINAVMITRVGRMLLDVIAEKCITSQKILDDIRIGLDELHDVGYAHCDLKIENCCVDNVTGVVFLDDLEYLTPVKYALPATKVQKVNKFDTAFELDEYLFKQFILVILKTV